MHPKGADRMANSAGPDQTAPLGAVLLWEQSDLGLHCLLGPFSPKTQKKLKNNLRLILKKHIEKLVWE